MISKTFIFCVLFAVSLSNPMKFMHMTKESGNSETKKSEHFIIANITEYKLSNLNYRKIQVTSGDVPILEVNSDQEIQDSPKYKISVEIRLNEGFLEISGEENEECNITLTGADVSEIGARAVDYSWRDTVNMMNNTAGTFQNMMIFKSEVRNDGTEVSFKFESFSSELSVAVSNAVCLKYMVTDKRKQNFI